MNLPDILPLLSNPEELRIRAAEADGWRVHPKDRFKVIPPNSPNSVQPLFTLPNYPTDANALHAAEQRLGLHSHTNGRLQLAWILNLEELIKTLPTCSCRCGKPSPSTIDYLLVPTPIRCAAFILTSAWKQKNQPEQKEQLK